MRKGAYQKSLMITAQRSLTSIPTLVGPVTHYCEMTPWMRMVILRWTLQCFSPKSLLPKHAICLQFEIQNDADRGKPEDISPAFDLAELALKLSLELCKSAFLVRWRRSDRRMLLSTSLRRWFKSCGPSTCSLFYIDMRTFVYSKAIKRNAATWTWPSDKSRW